MRMKQRAAGDDRGTLPGEERPLCLVKGCKALSHTGGLCRKHYQRKRLTGDAATPDRRRKLTEADVKKIRAARGFTCAALAAKFKVSESLVSAIRRGARRS